LALWDYVERSVRHVWGDSLGDPVADDILRLLRREGDKGVTRTDLVNHFGRHQPSERISAALGTLQDRRLAGCERQPTGGRPSERWFAAG
jgi:hypothetical protein